MLLRSLSREPEDKCLIPLTIELRPTYDKEKGVYSGFLLPITEVCPYNNYQCNKQSRLSLEPKKKKKILLPNKLSAFIHIHTHAGLHSAWGKSWENLAKFVTESTMISAAF